MKIVILTSNSLRHKFLANTLSQYCEDTLIISECKPQTLSFEDSKNLTEIEKHFLLRDETEKSFFPNDNYFIPKTLPVVYKEVNSNYVYDTIKKFKPDAMFVFGSSIIREPLISLLPPGSIINLHLGISPYYRGSGTNFWPFVNNELSFVGATILHLDPGIDTGDIVTHVRSIIEKNDDVHSIGCKVIRKGSEIMIKILDKIKEGHSINREKQWKVSSERYYRMKDFDEKSLKKYHENMKNGMIEKFLQVKSTDIRLIEMKF